MKSCWIAFSLYSKIPMPKAEWNEKNRRYVMCWFPWVGAVIGGLFWLLWQLCCAVGSGQNLSAVLMVLLPLLISGGIHADGFMDTIDARRSYAEKEKKLEILSDPHTGSFAILGCVMYYLLLFGFYSELCVFSESERAVEILAVGFVYSRAWSALGAVTFKPAKSAGLLADVAALSKKRLVCGINVLYLLLCVGLMIKISPIAGSITAMVGITSFFWYRRMAYREFGGITGDLAGYFLQICELSLAGSVVLLLKCGMI